MATAALPHADQSDPAYLDNIIVLEHIFPFPESSRDSNLISYAHLDRRGNKHIPLTISNRRFKLPDLSIALEHHAFAIHFPDRPLLARLESPRRARMESDHSAWRVV